jgi:hypothetical protein
MKYSQDGRMPYLRLGALTAAALAIHGYHLGVEDGEIYVPAVRKLLHPNLYPFATEFFTSHGHLSLFAPILAGSASLTHLSIDWTLFGWYVASIFALLAASWLFVSACFRSPRARWCAMLIVTAVLTMPATNTGLLLVDPYLTARSFSTPLTLFALASFLEARYAHVAIAMILTAAIHPQMVMYLLFLTFVMWVTARRKNPVQQPVPVLASALSILPTGFHLAPASGPYREALYSRDYFFLYNWAWYHWLGMLGPLAILAFFWRADLRGVSAGFRRISFALIPFGLISIAAAAVLASSRDFDMFARLQPLRSFHLITLVFVLLSGGVLGEYLAKGRPWVIAAVSLPLAAGMFLVARQTYPNSAQIEWPSATSPNSWVRALLWIRRNTPENAVFAVDANYFRDSVVDVHGFRAISERSALADRYKDSGVVSLFPALAEEWKQMSEATTGLNHFSAEQFRQLRSEYPQVSWTVIHGSAPLGMDCPYQQDSFTVCRMPKLSATSSPGL